MTGTVDLCGMEFFARHGCLESERLEGNTFVVDVRFQYDITAAAASDDLADAVNYAVIYDIVAAEMAVPSNLLEHVAARIAQAIRREFPQILSLSVCVAKKNPPVSGPAAWSKVTVEL